MSTFASFSTIGDCTFKTPMPENVINRGRIRHIKGKTTQVLTLADVRGAIETIQQEPLAPNWQTHRQHVARLKARHGAAPIRSLPADALSPQRPISSTAIHPVSHRQHPSCPKCGNTMVLRTASRGENRGNQFWGCSGYPACRGMVQLVHVHEGAAKDKTNPR